MSQQSTTLHAIATAGDVQNRAKPESFPMMLETYKREIERALPRHLNGENMMRVALTCFRMNQRLAECSPASVFACVVQASQLGLRPGLLGECFLIPYRQGDAGLVCTLQLGYQGLLELVRRSNLVPSISAYVVYQNDDFKPRLGTNPGIEHIPFLDGDAGPIRLVYAVAQLKGGGVHAEIMTLPEIYRIRDRSQNVQTAKRYGKQTPWDTDFGEMARKTVLRRICKFLPKSPDLAQALAIDDAAYNGRQQISMRDALDNNYVPPPTLIGDADPTGEVDPPSPPPPPPAPPPSVPTDHAPRRGRPPKNAPPPATSDAQPPAPETTTTQDAESIYKHFAEKIENAPDAERAGELLDLARSSATLDDARHNALAAQYRAKWMPQP